MSRFRVFTAVLAALVVLAAVGVGVAILVDGNGGEQQADDDVLRALTGGTFDTQQAQQAGQVAFAAGLIAGNAVACRDGTLGRAECLRDLRSYTKDLLEGLKGFDDDSLKRTTIDDALKSVNGLCDECEQMLRDARP